MNSEFVPFFFVGAFQLGLGCTLLALRSRLLRWVTSILANPASWIRSVVSVVAVIMGCTSIAIGTLIVTLGIVLAAGSS